MRGAAPTQGWHLGGPAGQKGQSQLPGHGVVLGVLLVPAASRCLPRHRWVPHLTPPPPLQDAGQQQDRQDRPRRFCGAEVPVLSVSPPAPFLQALLLSPFLGAKSRVLWLPHLPQGARDNSAGHMPALLQFPAAG